MASRTAKTDVSEHAGKLSIGALAAATGIPIDTIRTWERRYGFPRAERKPSGHRVYSLATVPRLRRVAQAIARGHRAAEVLSASDSALDGLLASVPRVGDSATPPDGLQSSKRSAEHGYTELFDSIAMFDAEPLKRSFQRDWSQLGPLEFLERRAAPFMRAIGDAWADRTLDVRHEHFASAVLGDFLRTVRGPLEERATGPVVALATLPGELHGLGLQMSAVVFAAAGWRALLIGVDTPVPQIVALARETSLAAVAVSCVQPRTRGSTATLRSLREKLPSRVTLLLGGAGAPESGGRGVEIFSNLTSLDLWVRNWRPAVG